MSAKVLQINYKLNGPRAVYETENLPYAEPIADVPGLRWKIWGVNEEESNFSGLLLFEDADALQSFLESDLAKAVTTHPALSDFEVTPFELMAPETMITHGPVNVETRTAN